MIQLKTIQKELIKLSICYPVAKRSNKELSILADIWFSDLQQLNEKRVLQAIDNHRNRSEFFPTIAAIKNEYQDLANMARELPSLPEPKLPPEQVKENIKKIRKVMADAQKGCDI